MADLLPCPFCGSAAEAYQHDGVDGVCCSSCPCDLYDPEDDGMVAAWNRRASGWVPVSERLPELDVPVWLWEPGRGAWIGERGDVGDGWLWGNCYGSEYWNTANERWATSSNEADDDYQPTHWQPLPAPPSPEEEATP